MAAHSSDVSIPADSIQAELPVSSHRLPTVSASDALQDLQNHGPLTLPSGLGTLDALLAGGFQRGKVTEIWGPTGAGKTGLILQTAAKSVLAGTHVVWLDAASPLSGPRLQSAVDALSTTDGETQHDALQRLHHKAMPSLTHLLALILHPQADFPPPKTSLLVVDGLNTLLDLDYPRFHQFGVSSRTEPQKWQATRRYAILGSLISGLNRLAALKDLAVIVSTGCSTRGRSESGLRLALVPGVGGSEWEGGVCNKMVVFRDLGGHLIGLQKVQGRSLISREEVGEPGRILPFVLAGTGALTERSADLTSAALPEKPQLSTTRMSTLNKPKKRVYDEIADSEDEEVDEYGWADADENVLVAGYLRGEDSAAPEVRAADA